jgi:hypothetical protein
LGEVELMIELEDSLVWKVWRMSKQVIWEMAVNVDQGESVSRSTRRKWMRDDGGRKELEGFERWTDKCLESFRSDKGEQSDQSDGRSLTRPWQKVNVGVTVAWGKKPIVAYRKFQRRLLTPSLCLLLATYRFNV